uniref:Large subunit GTPase 1 homolog n=1 Tax=Macrostomum lignano TaxID=282301 RepID=A0A1I8IMC3_9PLAT
VPAVPLLPCVAIAFNVVLILQLQPMTWIRFSIWLVIGLLIYFTYGINQSNENPDRQREASEKVPLASAMKLPESPGMEGEGPTIVQKAVQTDSPRCQAYPPPPAQTDSSVTHQGDLAEFLSRAELLNAKFDSSGGPGSGSLRLLSQEEAVAGRIGGGAGVLAKAARERRRLAAEELRNQLRIPRRPAWSPGVTSPAELESLERESFLRWREAMALLEAKDGVAMTPYEKNLDFWRQLWRVLERSQAVVQIVDARDPLFFYSPDLDAYAKECGCQTAVLLNKCDLLTPIQLTAWRQYFQTAGTRALFFSAKPAGSEADEDAQDVAQAEADEAAAIHVNESMPKVLAPDGLAEALADLAAEASLASSSSATGVPVVGLVGYPNVGKSSSINALLRAKKVPESATPGRTKHLQTLPLGDRLVLCDCPGLVMPQFVGTSADLDSVTGRRKALVYCQAPPGLQQIDGVDFNSRPSELSIKTATMSMTAAAGEDREDAASVAAASLTDFDKQFFAEASKSELRDRRAKKPSFITPGGSRLSDLDDDDLVETLRSTAGALASRGGRNKKASSPDDRQKKKGGKEDSGRVGVLFKLTVCQHFMLLFAMLAFGFVAMLLFMPNPIDPVAYQLPPQPPAVGPLAANDRLAAARKLLVGAVRGPESFVFVGEHLFTGTLDGRIVRVHLASEQPELWVRFGPANCSLQKSFSPIRCGRPLGLRRHPSNRSRLLVADAYLGLIDVNLDKRQFQSIIDRSNPIGVTFFDDLDITPDGELVFISEASTRYPLHQLMHQ